MTPTRKSWLYSMALLLAAEYDFNSVAFAQTVQEVRIQWESPIPAGPAKDLQPPTRPSAHVLTLRERRTVPGRLPRQRSPELSADQLVIIARAANGELLDWQVVPDPRLIRAEHARPGGELAGQVFRRSSADILLALPDHPDIRTIEIRHPRWTGTEFVLDLIGTVPLN